jgi:phage/plasmid-like protein (TIGR03299 family)
MSANLDMTNGRANFAFTGDRKDIWHREGTAMDDNMSVAEWIKAAGLDWEAFRTPAFTQLPSGEFKAIAGWSYLTRNDVRTQIGYVSDNSYKIAQPRDCIEAVTQFVSVDDRFTMNTAGSLDGGRRIWVNAQFNGDIEVGGSAHKAYLLASTSFDGTQATIAKGTMTRVVCDNTLAAAVGGRLRGKGDGGPEIRITHNAKFDPAQATKELGVIVQSFEKFKAMGDAMALVALVNGEVSGFFKKLLDIDPNDKWEELSTRKQNQFNAMRAAYDDTVKEGTEKGTVWTALNAVTRYVDHERSSRNGDNPNSARFDSALFGSGARMKEQAVGLLMPLIKDKVAA